MNPQRVNTLHDAWKAHPTRRKEFSDLLKDPCMVDAIKVISSQAFDPRPYPMPTGASFDLIQYASLMGAKREGYLECLENLLALAKVTPVTVPLPPSWESQGKEARIAAMEQELNIDPDTRLPNSPVKPAPIPATPETTTN